MTTLSETRHLLASARYVAGVASMTTLSETRHVMAPARYFAGVAS
jgi:hypothetical protein